MKEIAITTLDSTNIQSCAGVLNLYLLTGDADCLKRALFQANSQGWLPKPLSQSQIYILTSLSIDEVKDEIQSWFNPDVVKIILK